MATRRRLCQFPGLVLLPVALAAPAGSGRGNDLAAAGLIHRRLVGAPARQPVLLLDHGLESGRSAGRRLAGSGSLAARCLEWCSRFSLRHATKIIVLDRFMQQRILDKGIDPGRIVVIPPWSHDSEVQFDASGRDRFRKQHGLDGKFVVMYSGNHSPCHPLDTILEAARQLAEDREIAFLFVGGGSRFAQVKQFARERSLSNIQCLPYQPMDQLAGALSAADLHLVVMGDPFVGLVHPCKVYNILRVGTPLLYIGPQPSHISEILQALNGALPSGGAGHGEVNRVIEHITATKNRLVQPDGARGGSLAKSFSQEVLLPRLVATLESAASS